MCGPVERQAERGTFDNNPVLLCISGGRRCVSYCTMHLEKERRAVYVVMLVQGLIRNGHLNVYVTVAITEMNFGYMQRRGPAPVRNHALVLWGHRVHRHRMPRRVVSGLGS